MAYPAPKRTSIPALSSNYTKGRIKPIRVLVIHDGETGEGSTPAEGMGRWFQDPRANGSAHAGFDTDSICTYIADGDTAWAARGTNADGLHGELAGRAGQTASQWKDADSLRILENGAIWFAEKAIKHGIPVRYLTDGQVRDGKSKGITTHRQITRALATGTHTDPGPNFPADYFLSRIKAHVTRLTAPATTPTPKPPAARKVPIMHTLVQVKGQDAVWLSDLVHRRWVQTPAELLKVQNLLKARGVDATVREVSSLTTYGVAVGKVPA